MSKKLFLLGVLLIVFFAAEEMVVQKAMAQCERLSGVYSGPCINDNSGCERVCRRADGLLGGFCRGLQCWCRC